MKTNNRIVRKRILAGVLSVVLASTNLTGFSMVSLAAGVSGEENDPIVAEGSEAKLKELEPAAEETVDAADPEETEEPEEAEDVEEPEAGEDAQNPDEDEEPEKSEEPEAGEVAEEPEETDSEVIAGQQETANAEAELAAEDKLTELNLEESMFFSETGYLSYQFTLEEDQAGTYYVYSNSGIYTVGSTEIDPVSIKSSKGEVTARLAPISSYTQSAYVWDLKAGIYEIDLWGQENNYFGLSKLDEDDVIEAVDLAANGDAREIEAYESGYFHLVPQSNASSHSYYIKMNLNPGTVWTNADTGMPWTYMDDVYWFPVSVKDKNAYFIIPSVPDDASIQLVSEIPGMESLSSWDGSFSIPANSSRVFEYQATAIGDYYVYYDAFNYSNVQIEAIRGAKLYNSEECANYFTNYSNEKSVFTFLVSNYNDNEVEINLYTHRALYPTWMELDETYNVEEYFPRYYSFQADEAGFYTLSNATYITWGYYGEDGTEGLHLSSYDSIQNGIWMQKDEIITLKTGNLICIQKAGAVTELKEPNLDLSSGNYYIFTPLQTGKYYIKRLTELDPDKMTVYVYDRTDNSYNWQDWEQGESASGKYLELESGHIYILYAEAKYNVVEEDDYGEEVIVEKDLEDGEPVCSLDREAISAGKTVTGTTLKMTSNSVYTFKPTVTGVYVSEDETIQYYNETNKEWVFWSDGEKKLTKNVTYKLRKSSNKDLVIGILNDAIKVDTQYTLLGSGYGYGKYNFTPTAAGTYSFTGTALNTSVYLNGRYVSPSNIPVKSNFKEVWTLEKGKTYTVRISGPLGSSFKVSKITGDAATTLTLDGKAVTVTKGKTGTFKIPLPESEGNDVYYYVGMNSVQTYRTSDIYDCSNGTPFWKDSEGWNWICLSNRSDSSAGYLVLPNVTKDTQIKLVSVPKEMTKLTDWTQTITLKPNETRYFSFQTNTIGDYYIQWDQEAVSVDTITDNGFMSADSLDGEDYDWSSNIVRGAYGNSFLNTMTVSFCLTNNSDTEQTVELYTEADERAANRYKVIELGELYGVNDTGRNYYSFTAPKDGIYSIKAKWFDAAYWKSTAGEKKNLDLSEYTGSFYDDEYDDEDEDEPASAEYIPLRKGESIVFCAGYQCYIKVDLEQYFEVTNASSLTMKRYQYYAFQPETSGVYGLYEQDASYMRAYYYDMEDFTWKRIAWNNTKKAYCMDMDENEVYFLRFESNSTVATLTKEKTATVIDYDYYQAFTASGGSVTVDGSTVNVAKGKSGWKQLLQTAVYSLIGNLTGKSMEDRYSQSNKYWNTKEGPYVASSFYKLENGTPVQIEENEITENDVVLIKYEPEIVWVQSLNITADQNNTTLQTGETVTLNANPSKGQSKYDYRKDPVITWVSSDENVLKVEADKTGSSIKVTAVGAGVATITATADEALRASEGLKPIAVSSIKLTVYDKPTLEDLTVVPARSNIVLSYNKSNRTYQPVTTYATLQVAPSNFMLDNSNLTWSWVNNNTYEQISDSAEVTFTEAGEYTVTATYTEVSDNETDSKKEVSASATVTVTEEDKPIPLTTGVEINRFYNVESGLKLSDVTYEIEADLLATAIYDTDNRAFKSEDGSGITGTFTYKSGKTTWNSKTKLPKGKTVLTVTYTPNADEVAEGYTAAAVSTTVTINYAVLSMGITSTNGTTLVYAEENQQNTSGYSTETALTPYFSFNGKTYSISELVELMKERRDKTEAEGEEAYSIETGLKVTSGNGKITVSNGEEEGIYEYGIYYITAAASGKAKVSYCVSIDGLEGSNSSYQICKDVTINVNSMSRIVDTISVTPDEASTDLDEMGLPRPLANGTYLYYEKQSKKDQVMVLDVDAKDSAGDSFEPLLYSTKKGVESAKLQWSTSNKKVAYVSATDKGGTKLIIPKNASGVAKITVKSATNASAQLTFNVVVYDTDVRLDTTKVALNSYSYNYGTIYLYPNLVYADQTQAAEPEEDGTSEEDEDGLNDTDPGDEGNQDYKIKIQAVKQKIVKKKVVGYEEDTRFNVTSYDLSTGTVRIRFTNSARKTAKGSYTVYLKITQTVKGNELAPVYKKITVTNTPSVPKTTVKVLKNYNKFLGQNAVLQVTTSAALAEDGYEDLINPTESEKLQTAIELASGSPYTIKEIKQTASNQYQVELEPSSVASLKVGKSSSLTVSVWYADYRMEKSVSVKVTAENKAPTLGLSAYQPKNATIYSKLDNTIQVLLKLPTELDAKTAYEAYSANNAILQLTSAVQKEKKFKISEVALAEDSNALIVTLTSLNGKTGAVQFTLGKVAPLTGSVTSGKLTINVKNVNTMKLSMQDTTTGKSATTYTLRQMSAGKEVLNLKAILSDSSIDYSTSVYAADTFTDNALKSGALVLVKSGDGKSFQVKATAALFKLITKKNNSCKLKFTAYSGNVALNSATVTLKLDTTAEKKVAIKVSLKASGTLNVVNPASTVTITPTFTNVPLGATIKDISFTDTADENRYDMKVNYQTGKLTLSLHQNEDGSYASIPTGKDSIGLKYKILQVDGTYRELTASTTITVAQTAAVNANKTSLTLYNVATGISYGKTVTLNVTKAGNASIESISISGLSGSGISWKQDENTPNRITFYVDPEQNRGIDGKTYTANLTVTLNGAGKKSGKLITYKVPIKINLAK